MDKEQDMEILVLPGELTKALQEVPFVRDLKDKGVLVFPYPSLTILWDIQK